MRPVNDISKKQRAAKAGFIKFCPSPPYNCFTIIIANRAPITGIHRGTVDGRFNARMSPVTTAEQSLIVIGFFIKYSNKYSDNTQVSTDTMTISAAFNLN